MGRNIDGKWLHLELEFESAKKCEGILRVNDSNWSQQRNVKKYWG